MNRVAVVSAGPLTTLQDAGRAGLAHLGVPPSGAFDRNAFALGNHLVGNAPHAAALEATLVAPTLRFAEAAVVAVTGARTALAHGEPIEVTAGATLELGPCRDGVRAYIAVYGGFDAEPVLGSRSHDLLTGLGPPPLRDGDELVVGDAAGEPTPPPPVRMSDVLRIAPGPRDDWFEPEALDILTGTTWRVANASNRVGLRLEGPPLPRLERGELLSEGVVTGALQVPPSGRPILLGPDHPTTGGYPILAVVLHDDVPLAAQLGPGAPVRFALGRGQHSSLGES
ncbi:MAG TPA: biotin-dependent carboxyltransferase family protein [Gaiellaceae bacterium]|nr:biotin-dependent carboxyltransferase family protein [Gaiellaceae bacterium]